MCVPDTRMAVLQLYDAVAQHITLDLTGEREHLPGCAGTLHYVQRWIGVNAPEHQQTWQHWLEQLCVVCDCALLLQLNTFTVEYGATEGLNMRRCSSCNALLALYVVTRDPSEDITHVMTWARSASVPAFVVRVTSTAPAAPAVIQKVYPPGETYHLTAQQFYRSVLHALERHHQCF